MKFKINNKEFLAVKTKTNAWGIFKCEPKNQNGLSECLYTAKNDAELQGVLKRLFIKEVFKPLERL